MSFPRFRRRYECLLPIDDRPKGIVDEKAVSNDQFMCTYFNYFTVEPWITLVDPYPWLSVMMFGNF